MKNDVAKVETFVRTTARDLLGDGLPSADPKRLVTTLEEKKRVGQVDENPPAESRSRVKAVTQRLDASYARVGKILKFVGPNGGRA